MVHDRPCTIAILLKSLRGGGAERVILTLAAEFASRGYRVDLLISRMRGPLQEAIPPNVTVHVLEMRPLPSVIYSLVRLPVSTWMDLARTFWKKVPKIVLTLPSLQRYLLQKRPHVLLSTLPMPNIVAAWATHLANTDTALILREANHFSVALNPENRFDRFMPKLAGRWYPQADGIIAVSNGVALDLATSLAIPQAKIAAILNPVDLAKVQAACSQEPSKEIIQALREPFMLAVGKLTPQKGFDSLIKAFAGIRSKHSVQLIILGEGPELSRLQALASQLGIADDVRFPGHVSNPYAYMRRCSVFVLSSAWEGCPNVLLEALACGCPIVSTDCPSGPREILANGKYGKLVPVGDVMALASEIDGVLNGGGMQYSPSTALRDYSVEGVAARYLEVFGRAAECLS